MISQSFIKQSEINQDKQQWYLNNLIMMIEDDEN